MTGILPNIETLELMNNRLTHEAVNKVQKPLFSHKANRGKASEDGDALPMLAQEMRPGPYQAPPHPSGSTPAQE
jgi:hypothetical protein